MSVTPANGGTNDPSSSRRPEFEIRPGVIFPDWDVVRSSVTEAALLAMFEAVGVGRRWTGHEQDADGVYRAILSHFAAHGRAPSNSRLSEITGMAPAVLRRSLRDLAARDLIVLDPARHAVTGAYPFTGHATEHRVIVDGRTVHAMCAVDALGAPAMIGRDAAIESSCRACQAPIRVETQNKGTTLTPPAPGDAVVWLDLRHANGCSATSLCAATAFFCSDAHLQAWRESPQPTRRGHRLSMTEAHQLGMAIFLPRLTPPKPQP